MSKSLLQKIQYNWIMICFLLIRRIFSVMLFPLRFFIYKGISLNSFVSFKSSIRNHKVITIGKRVEVNDFVVLWPTRLTIGEESQINPGTAIYGDVIIGSYVMIAPNCMLAGGNHNFNEVDIPMKHQGSNEKGIVIGNNVWIGANSTILDGVTIGNNCVIGANSLVSKSLPDYSIAVGNPAKIIKDRRY